VLGLWIPTCNQKLQIILAAASRQGQQYEGSSQPPGAAERGQQPAARGRMTAATSRQGQQNEGSSQPSRAAERGQQPAARGSRTKAATSRQWQQNESSQPPGAAERGQQPGARGSIRPPGKGLATGTARCF